MNHEEIWAAIGEQRRRTVAVLEQLTPAEWEHPTLCEQWTVRDLAGHLSIQGMTLGGVLRMMAEQPAMLTACFGGLNRTIRETAKVLGRVPTDQLVERVRATVPVQRPNVGLTEYEALLDIMIHSQDLAIPLGRQILVPPEAAAVVADRIISPPKPGVNKVFADLGASRCRLVATDIEWSSGSGPLVEGPMTGLMLLVGGRRAGLDQLTGPGAEELRATRSSHTPR